MKDDGNKQYNFAEAYCIMLYRCEKCKKIEMIWNSRDGVTPFCVNCVNCNGLMQSFAWKVWVRIKKLEAIDNIRVFIDSSNEDYPVDIITYDEYKNKLMDKGGNE